MSGPRSEGSVVHALVSVVFGREGASLVAGASFWSLGCLFGLGCVFGRWGVPLVVGVSPLSLGCP